jgi:hypothetical protein
MYETGTSNRLCKGWQLMSDRNGIYLKLVNEYEDQGFTYEEASWLAIKNLKHQYDYEEKDGEE